MAKFTQLDREEEYYRPGVWKIYYKLADQDYTFTITRPDGSRITHESGADEIKFSGKDAAERSLAVFNLMQEENKGL